VKTIRPLALLAVLACGTPVDPTSNESPTFVTQDVEASADPVDAGATTVDVPAVDSTSLDMNALAATAQASVAAGDALAVGPWPIGDGAVITNAVPTTLQVTVAPEVYGCGLAFIAVEAPEALTYVKNGIATIVLRNVPSGYHRLQLLCVNADSTKGGYNDPVSVLVGDASTSVGAISISPPADPFLILGRSYTFSADVPHNAEACWATYQLNSNVLQSPPLTIEATTPLRRVNYRVDRWAGGDKVQIICRTTAFAQGSSVLTLPQSVGDDTVVDATFPNVSELRVLFANPPGTFSIGGPPIRFEWNYLDITGGVVGCSLSLTDDGSGQTRWFTFPAGPTFSETGTQGYTYLPARVLGGFFPDTNPSTLLSAWIQCFDAAYNRSPQRGVALVRR
jgi:hypothetical protein